MEGQPRTTPLYEAHLRLGARIVEFAGWLLPVQFRSIIEEHLAVRAAAGVFDISHMGQIRVAGSLAFELLQRVLTNDLTGLGAGQGLYSLLCSEDGGIVDDAYIFHCGPEEFLLVGNAVNADTDYQWLVQHGAVARGGVVVDQLTGARGGIAVQGPKAVDILNPLADLDLAAIPARQCRQTRLAGVDVLISRTGYTGEDGFEVFMAAEDTDNVWAAALDAGAVPCGLGARDTLRLEAALPLYGHEIDLATNPFQAGLGWATKPGKGEFVGRAALLKIAAGTIGQKLICFEMLDRGIPREHYTLAKDGVAVGYVTSGTYSPTLDKGIGMGYVSSEWAHSGHTLQILIRERPLRAVVVRRPFYRRREVG